jgi:hypothetical protein
VRPVCAGQDHGDSSRLVGEVVEQAHLVAHVQAGHAGRRDEPVGADTVILRDLGILADQAWPVLVEDLDVCAWSRWVLILGRRTVVTGN